MRRFTRRRGALAPGPVGYTARPAHRPHAREPLPARGLRGHTNNKTRGGWRAKPRRSRLVRPRSRGSPTPSPASPICPVPASGSTRPSRSRPPCRGLGPSPGIEAVASLPPLPTNRFLFRFSRPPPAARRLAHVNALRVVLTRRRLLPPFRPLVHAWSADATRAICCHACV
jgi:hypothetical protein